MSHFLDFFPSGCRGRRPGQQRRPPQRHRPTRIPQTDGEIIIQQLPLDATPATCILLMEQL